MRRQQLSVNIAALGAVQVANYLIPLLVLPYLTRTLGQEVFGTVVIVLGAIQLAFVLTDYGFSISATQAISANRDNKDLVGHAVGAIFAAKVLLLFPAVAAVIVFFSLHPALAGKPAFAWAAVLAIVAQAYQPIWFFHGIERMKSYAFYMVSSKGIYAALLLALVNSENDGVWVIFSWASANAVGALIGLIQIYREGYRVHLPSVNDIVKVLVAGAQFFWSRIAVALYTSGNVLVVGTNAATQAAQYAVCEQIYKAGQNVSGPLNQALFPYMVRNKDWLFYAKIVAAVAFVLALGCFLVFHWRAEVLVLLFGQEYAEAVDILAVFLVAVTINYLSVSFGYPVFGALGAPQWANYSVIVGAILHFLILAAAFLFYEINALIVAGSVLVVEFAVLVMRIIGAGWMWCAVDEVRE